MATSALGLPTRIRKHSLSLLRLVNAGALMAVLLFFLEAGEPRLSRRLVGETSPYHSLGIRCLIPAITLQSLNVN
jgi:hypothetical protein